MHIPTCPRKVTPAPAPLGPGGGLKIIKAEGDIFENSL